MTKFADNLLNSIWTSADVQTAIKNGAFIWAGVATGSSNAFAVTSTPSVTELYTGLTVAFISNQDVTGTPTLSIGGTTAKSLYAGLTPTALASKSIASGDLVVCIYDATIGGSTGGWRVISPYTPVLPSWSPSVSASGSMGVSSWSTVIANYHRQGKKVSLSLAGSFTTTGSASTDIVVTLPITGAVANDQVFACHIYDTGLLAGIAYVSSSTQMTIRKPDSSNWGIAASKAIKVAGHYFL